MGGDSAGTATTYDAVLIGGGLGSLAAAIRLSEHGLRPLIVEKALCVGGASAYSGGLVWAPDNHCMRARGFRDSADEALRYLETVSMGRWDPSVAETYVRSAPDVIQWLEGATALKWLAYGDLPDYYAEMAGGKHAGRCVLPKPGYAATYLEAASRRQPALQHVRASVHFPGEASPWSAGRALVAFLWSRILELGTPYRLGASATRLITDGGTVTGVQLEEPAGSSVVYGRRGVLLNTGGFEWNPEMTKACVPGPYAHPQTPPIGDGDGHVMAAELGGALALMDQTTLIPAIRVPGEENDGHPLYRLYFQELAYPHSLVVNRAGRRFANETFFPDIARGWSQYDDRSAQWPNVPLFHIFDEQYRRAVGLPGSLAVGPCLSSHPDLKSLAETRGIDPLGLEAQVLRLNEDAAAGVDTQYHRGSTAYQRTFAARRFATENPAVGTIAEPPYYCVELFPSTSGHRGGLVTDSSGRVIDVRGDALGGLYACGSAAAGLVTGGSYLSGVSVGQAIVFGALAADAMVAAEPATSRAETLDRRLVGSALGVAADTNPFSARTTRGEDR